MRSCFLLFIFVSTVVRGQSALEGLFVEEYYHVNKKDLKNIILSGPIDVNAVTYRVYLDLAPGCRFQAAYGSPAHPLIIQSKSIFYNHAEVGNYNVNVIPERMLKRNLVALDSWLSVGAVSENLVGIPMRDDTLGLDQIYAFEKGYYVKQKKSMAKSIREYDGAKRGVFVPFPTFYNMDTAVSVLGSVPKGNLFQVNNGAWACLGKGSVGVDSLGVNMVLIGQFTTSGGLDYKLNVMVRNADGKSVKYVYDHAQEGEEVMSFLTGSILTSNNDKKRKK
jgi:hypothetical protein